MVDGSATGPFAGAVLAGGASRRMGTDKALIPVDGVAMLDRVVAALRGAGADPVAQVGGLARRGDLIVVDDQTPGSGPLAGVQSALRWSPHPIVVVVACDLPNLTTDVVRAVVRGLGPGVAVAVARSDRPEPLCAAWRRDDATATVDEVLASGRRAVRDVLGRLAVAEVPVDLRAVRNVNHPGDLADR
jgi:molybdenum cofactor guanylyltransferase